MYQNLINSLKKILDSKSTPAEKLLKISTLVDFADGLERPQREFIPASVPAPDRWNTPQIPNPTVATLDAKNPSGPGALVGVEDIK